MSNRFAKFLSVSASMALAAAVFAFPAAAAERLELKQKRSLRRPNIPSKLNMHLVQPSSKVNRSA